MSNFIRFCHISCPSKCPKSESDLCGVKGGGRKKPSCVFCKAPLAPWRGGGSFPALSRAPAKKRGTPRCAGLGRAPAAHRRRRGPRQPGRPALRQPPSRREALRPVLRGNPLKTQKRRGILSGCPFVFSARRGGKGPLAAHGPCKKAFSYSCGRVSSCPGKIREGFEMSSRLSA